MFFKKEELLYKVGKSVRICGNLIRAYIRLNSFPELYTLENYKTTTKKLPLLQKSLFKLAEKIVTFNMLHTLASLQNKSFAF